MITITAISCFYSIIFDMDRVQRTISKTEITVYRITLLCEILSQKLFIIICLNAIFDHLQLIIWTVYRINKPLDFESVQTFSIDKLIFDELKILKTNRHLVACKSNGSNQLVLVYSSPRHHLTDVQNSEMLSNRQAQNMNAIQMNFVKTLTESMINV